MKNGYQFTVTYTRQNLRNVVFMGYNRVMKALAYAFIFIFFFNFEAHSAFSYGLKNKGLTNLLKGTNLQQISRYRNIAIYSTKNKAHLLIYVWKEEVIIKEFNYNPCKVIATEMIELAGAGFSVFKNANERALTLKADAIQVGEEDKDTTEITFFKCH
jgi:hypothetical protein